MASAVADVPTGHLAGPLSVVLGLLLFLAALAGAALLVAGDGPELTAEIKGTAAATTAAAAIPANSHTRRDRRGGATTGTGAGRSRVSSASWSRVRAARADPTRDSNSS